MVIHFFRSRSEERIDFEELIDNYFGTMPNVHITSDDEALEVMIDIPDFEFAYRYLITKRSRVSSIYKLNSDFININMLVEIPLNIPQFLLRMCLQQIDEMCRKFKLVIYYEQLDNIREFRMFEMLQSLLKEREKYFEEHPEVVRYAIAESKLNQICIYQKIQKDLSRIVKCDLMPNPYIVLLDKRTGRVELSINFKAGEPTVFPPQLSYVHVEEEENLINVIPIDAFMKIAERHMYDIKDSGSDLKMLFLNEKGSLKVKKHLKKVRKYMISSSNFDVIKLINLIEG